MHVMRTPYLINNCIYISFYDKKFFGTRFFFKYFYFFFKMVCLVLTFQISILQSNCLHIYCLQRKDVGTYWQWLNMYYSRIMEQLKLLNRGTKQLTSRGCTLFFSNRRLPHAVNMYMLMTGSSIYRIYSMYVYLWMSYANIFYFFSLFFIMLYKLVITLKEEGAQPNRHTKSTVIRSPHIDKRGREQFRYSVARRYIQYPYFLSSLNTLYSTFLHRQLYRMKNITFFTSPYKKMQKIKTNVCTAKYSTVQTRCLKKTSVKLPVKKVVVDKPRDNIPLAIYVMYIDEGRGLFVPASIACPTLYIYLGGQLARMRAAGTIARGCSYVFQLEQDPVTGNDVYGYKGMQSLRTANAMLVDNINGFPVRQADSEWFTAYTMALLTNVLCLDFLTGVTLVDNHQRPIKARYPFFYHYFLAYFTYMREYMSRKITQAHHVTPSGVYCIWNRPLTYPLQPDPFSPLVETHYDGFSIIDVTFKQSLSQCHSAHIYPSTLAQFSEIGSKYIGFHLTNILAESDKSDA